MGFWSTKPSDAESSASASSSASGSLTSSEISTPDRYASASSSSSSSAPASSSPPAPASTSATSSSSQVWIPDELTAPPQEEEKSRIAVPSNLLLLPSVAALIGFMLGSRRGGQAARLRFLAENAHRQPKTVQGWYFYLKTRNYKIFFGGMRAGGKYALGLGGATAMFVAMDETAGWARERVLEHSPAPFRAAPTDVNPDRWGWRKGPVHYADGIISGSALAMIVGLSYRLPSPLILRGILMGSAAGGLYSGLQIAQDKVASMRRSDAQQRKAAQEAEEAAERERRVAQGLSPDPEPTEDERKSPEERNFFEKIGAWARGRDSD